MKVEVRPIEKKTWHGKKGQESFSRPKVIEVLIDPQTGKYATGLTEEEAEEYSKKLGVDLSDTVSFGEPHPYWSTKPAWLVLENRTMVFDSNNPAHFVKIKNMKASSKVANSVAEYEQGLFPEATHVIYDEAEQLQIQASKISIKNTVIKELASKTDEAKAAIIAILSDKYKSVRGQSTDFITVEINHLVETKPNEVYRLLKMNKDDVYLRAKVLELTDKNILSEKMGSYYYMGELIGMDYEDAINWFKDPKNATLKVAILEKLEKSK